MKLELNETDTAILSEMATAAGVSPEDIVRFVVRTYVERYLRRLAAKRGARMFRRGIFSAAGEESVINGNHVVTLFPVNLKFKISPNIPGQDNAGHYTRFYEKSGKQNSELSGNKEK